MQDIKSLATQVEQLRKEIGYIVKVILPSLKPGGDTSALKKQVESNTQAIDNIKKEFEAMSADISNMSSSVSANTNQLNSLNTLVRENKQSLQTATANISALEDGLADLTESTSANTSKLSQLESQLQTNTQNIQSLQMSQSNHSSELQNQALQIVLLQNSLDSAKNKITNIETTLSAQSSKLTSLENSIKTANTNITTLETSVSSLNETVQQLAENMSQGGQDTTVTIYDMKSTDTAVNLGYTTGIVGGTVVYHDFSQYKKVVFYANLNKSDCTAIMHLDKRHANDITLHTAGTLLNKVWYLKVVIPSDKDRVSVNYAGAYEVDSAGTFTFARSRGDAAYYIFRIEGIK